MSTSQSLYREVLSKAWMFTWSNKRLWILGFFATFLQTSGIIEVILRIFSRIPQSGWDLTTVVQNAYPGAAFVGGLMSVGKNATASAQAIGVLLIIVALFALTLWVIGSMEGGLIWSASKRKVPSITKTFLQGRRFAWSIVGLHVLAKLLLAVCFITVSLPLFLVVQHNIFQNLLVSVISLLIFFPLVLVVSFTAIYAVCAIVIKQQRLPHAIETAWRMFKSYWVISLETAVILFGISMAGGLAIVIFVLLLSIPATLITVAAIIAGSGAISTVVMAMILIVAIIAILVTGSFITTLQLVTWTFMFERLSKQGALSKLARILHMIPRLFVRKA